MLEARRHSLRHLLALPAGVGLALLCLTALVLAERLPIKIYTIADGLARDHVRRIVPDSHGFLWFCTSEGLSRFDGYRFVNYGARDGLPTRLVSDLLETRSGVYWVATITEVSRFVTAPGAQRKFVPLAFERAPGAIEDLYEDHTGTVWIAADHGLFRIETKQAAERAVEVHLPQFDYHQPNANVNGLSEDPAGVLWVTTTRGLYRRWPDGKIERFAEREGLPESLLKTALLTDQQGRRWLGTSNGLYQLVDAPVPGRKAVARIWGTADGLLNDVISFLFESRDGRLLCATRLGLSWFAPQQAGAGQVFHNYGASAGLSDKLLLCLAEDHDGNLWLGSENGGAMKIVANGFSTYDESDGFSGERVAAILLTSAGELCVASSPVSGSQAAKLAVNRFRGQHFESVKIGLPAGLTGWSWGWYQTFFQSLAGEWWMATGQGVVRYPLHAQLAQLPHTRPQAIYTKRDGLGGDEIFRLFEDRQGDVWIGTLTDAPTTLTRWLRASATFQRFPAAQYGLPQAAPCAFAEDASGQLWIGFYNGGVARFTGQGFQYFTEADGIPKGFIRTLYLDQRRRLWIATSEGGVARLDEPQAAQLRTVVYSTANGLASDQVTCVTEDHWGRIYLGTGRGVDRLEVESGRIKHFTTADGLASNFINVALRDAAGTLWFGTLQGVSRLIPRPDRVTPPPPVYISGLRVAGEPVPLAELGETSVNLPALTASKNQLDIEFVGLSFETGAALLYQYKLEGARNAWGQPTGQRSLSFANLAPGSYRFLVRALNTEGAPSPAPAVISFLIRPPLWQTWWFSALVLAAIVTASYVFYQNRLRRVVELERVRTRIATELHDDIGTSLSRITLLSEVLKQQTGPLNLKTAKLLNDISDSAREVLDNMGDIVWSIDPRRDDFTHVVARIGQFAADVLGARRITWEFEVAPEIEQLRLKPEARRQLYLIFKEALNNIAKHARCSSVTLKLVAHNRQLVAEIHDDGCGFDVASVSAAPGLGGNGLGNMRTRTEQIGGHLQLESAPGQGTKLSLQVPLANVTA